MTNAKMRNPVSDYVKSALGLGAMSWIVAALICPNTGVPYSGIMQLLVAASGATMGAVLSYLFRERHQSGAAERARAEPREMESNEAAGRSVQSQPR
jgi:hypothetical protein